MVRPNVPAGAASSQNRPRATTNTSRSRAIPKIATQNASKRTPSDRPHTTTTTATTTGSHTSKILCFVSDKEKLLMDMIPLFDQYQNFCVTDEAVNDDDAVYNDGAETINHNTKLQLRNDLTSKVIAICNMNEVVSEMKHLSVIEESDNELNEPKSTLLPKRLSMITECFVHIMNSAMAHLSSLALTSSGRNTSLMASSAILELLVPVAIAWDKEQQIHGSGKDFVGDVETILSLLRQYSACQNDTIRIVSVRALCCLAECIGCSAPRDDSFEQQRLEYLDTIQQALLPRFTDKTIAVRCAVVQACFTLSKIQSNPLCTDPDLLQAVQWVVQHDPSPNNRMIAIQHVPINRTTIEYLIPRIRDTKVNVRIAAINALSKAVDRTVLDASDPLAFLLPSRHMAEIVTAGYTDRCVTTKEAIRRMVCTSWIKAAKFDPITLLRWIDVMDHPTVATTILQIWYEISNGTTPPWFQDDLQDSDQQRFRNGMKASIGEFTVSDLVSGDNETLTEKLFIGRNLLQMMASDYEKDMLWSQLIPDIPVLCQVLETLSARLVAIAASQISLTRQNHDHASEHEDSMIFLCLELLQLASVNASSMEEGSRRVMAGTIKNLLSNVVTPDDLLEGCLTTLEKLMLKDEDDDSIEMGILPIIQHLSDLALSSENELFQFHTSIRIVSLITLTLEARGVTSDLAFEALEHFFSYVRPAMSHKNRLLRQAAVRTMGLLGMSSTAEQFLPKEDFTSALLGISCDDEEEIEIRIQAMFGLTDWVMLQFRNSNPMKNNGVVEALCCQVDQLLQVPIRFNQGTTCCAAEIATKLILTLFMDDSTTSSVDQADRIRTWLARLVLLYFDNENKDSDDRDESDDDVTQVGHPVRLQQLLSAFFPALTSTGTSILLQSSSFLIESITPMLKLSAQLQKSKKSSKAAAESLRWVRCIDFVVSNVCKSRIIQTQLLQMHSQDVALTATQVARQIDATEHPTDDESIKEDKVIESSTESSPGLIASVQIASFLSDQGSVVGAAICRTLCKWISNQLSCLDVENELWEDLSRFKEILEELVDNEGIEDSSSRRMLEPVLQMLRNVDSDIDNDDDEEVDEEVFVSLSNAISSVDISSSVDGNENAKSTTTVVSTAKYSIENASTTSDASAIHRSLRAQRRLRPSN